MWAQAINAMLGLWLMVAPQVLDYPPPAATNDQVVGPFVATFATIAMWQVTRGLRWANLPLGLWLVAAPAVLNFPTDAAVNSVGVGLAVSALCLVRGRITHRFAGGWTVLVKAPRA